MMYAALPSSEFRLARSEAGGFRVDGDAGLLIEALAVPGGWIVEDDGGARGCFLRETDKGPGGLVLLAGPGDNAKEMAWASRLSGKDSPPSCLLTNDGRAFNVLLRGPRDARFDLVGWETPGAYLQARPTPHGYSITRTVAGRDLAVGADMLLLFAAAILEADTGTIAG